MPLVPDSTRRGVWTPAQPQQAGVHAVIIGVSDYPYLGDGSAPPAERAPDNGGLRQLEVCARTAARIFDWLKQSGKVAGAPLASVRLLLAPRAAEAADVNALTGGAYAPADFATVRAALEAWADDIAAGNRAGGPNVAFFFFSGHGTEYMSSPALLASDILNPRSAAAGRKAVGFLSLCSVKTLGIDRALFFVDACRDVPAVARALNIVGAEILKPNPYPPRTHDSLISLQSTRSGGTAFQVPGDSATIFGRAVLEGLEGLPPSYVPYDTSYAPWRLLFARLETHVKQRVRELLAAQTATRFQQVVPYGDPYDGDMLVAEKVASLAPTAEEEPPAAPPSPPTLDAEIAVRSEEILRNFSTVTAETIAPLRGQRSAGVAATGDLANFPVMHEILRHETVTQPWIESVRVLDADTGESVSPDPVILSEGHSQEVWPNLTAWVDVMVAPGEGAVWIEVPGDSTTFAVVLPRDTQFPLPARLDLSFKLDTTPGTGLQAMAARVGDPDALGSDPARAANLRTWQALWRIQRIEALFDLGRAGSAAADVLSAMEEALNQKMLSPVGAAIGASVLLRCGALAELHDWPRNLANWFALPDGPLLWAETLLRRDEQARARERQSGRSAELTPAWHAVAERPACAEARRYFAMLADRGSPLLGSSLLMAAHRVQFWRRILAAEVLDAQDYRDLEDACAVVETAARYAVSDGLFAGFAGPAASLSAGDVLSRGRRGRRASEPAAPIKKAAAG